jgi:hypothetical protein
MIYRKKIVSLFMNYIKKHTENFLRQYLVPPFDKGDGDRIIVHANADASGMENPLDSIKFITAILEKNEALYQEHLLECRDKENCDSVFEHEAVAYHLTKELKNYGQGELNEDIFTAEEKAESNSKLNEILAYLQTLRDGQEIIYDEIAELKELHFLGKKNWKQLAVGKMTEVVASGVIEEATAQKLLEAITKDLPKLLDT